MAETAFFTEQQLERITEVAEDLFAQAVAQGMHAPFALNCESWGRDYAGRLYSHLSSDVVPDDSERTS